MPNCKIFWHNLQKVESSQIWCNDFYLVTFQSIPNSVLLWIQLKMELNSEKIVQKQSKWNLKSIFKNITIEPAMFLIVFSSSIDNIATGRHSLTTWKETWDIKTDIKLMSSKEVKNWTQNLGQNQCQNWGQNWVETESTIILLSKWEKMG